MKITRLSKRVLSLLVVAVMMLGVCAPVVSAIGPIEQLHKDSAGEGTLHYVSLGASNTNGFGHHGYLPPEVYEDPLAANKAQMNDYGYLKEPANAYPNLIKEALAEATGREVELHQLAISSMRVEEVLYLLDDSYVPDEYMEWRFTGGKSWFDAAEDGGIPALKEAYTKYVTEADVITVDLGWNNFGVYAFNNIMTILKEGGTRYWKAPAFDRVVDAGMEEEYYAIRDKVIARLNEQLDLSGTALSNEVIEKLADVLAYAAFGACYNYDKIIERIYELNPDATVVTINIQNLADELVVNLDGTELPLGDLYGELIEFVDFYRASQSPYADEVLFAYAGEDGDVDTFLDEFRLWDGDPATLSQDMKDLFDMYDDNLYVRSKIEYIMVGQVFGQIFANLRDTATSYGLSAFNNDEYYTYEIPAFDMAWLDGIDLAELDFNNPDSGLEYYGAAVSRHLVNLRNYEGEGKNAYNYVFDNLTYGLTGGEIATLDEAIAQRNYIATLDPAIQEAYKSLIQFVTILETARNEFNNAFYALYVVYTNTLNYAYDTVGTIIQYSLQFNTFYMTPDSMSNHNDKTKELLGYVVNTFTNNTMLKFYEELGKVGMGSGAVAPEIAVNEELFSDPLIQAVAALEVRYDFGNSFFAHPSVKGMKQIRDAVMDVLENGSHGDEFADKKLNLYIDLFEAYLNPYYQEKFNELKENGTIDAMLSGIDVIEGAMNELENELLGFEIPDDLDIDHETAGNIKNLMLEEIANIRVSAAELRALLKMDTLELDTSSYAKLVEAQRNLKAHADTLGRLAVQIGVFAEPYVLEVARVAEFYALVVADMASEAYDYLANGVEEFNAEYLEFVELVGSYADRIDVSLGAAVRAYLIDTPVDALNVICTYGEDAVLKFIVDASVAGENLYYSISAIAAILAEHGDDIGGRILADGEYQALVAEIKQKTVELLELYRAMDEDPLVTAIDIDLVLKGHKADLEDLYARLTSLVSKTIEEYDAEVAELLWVALNDTVDALGVLAEDGGEYLVWLDGRTDAMLGALLYSFVENSLELGGATDAVIWKYLNLLDALVTDAYNHVEAQIRLQIAVLEGKLAELKREADAALSAKIAELEAKIAELRAMLDKGVSDVSALLAEIKALAKAIDELTLDDLVDLICELECLNAIRNMLKDELRALAIQLLDRTLDALKIASPYIDAYLYDYFYNNPEEVIAFYEKYGHYIESCANEYGDEALGVIAYLLYEYGDDAVAYVIANPEESLEFICAWYEKHGVRIWPMVKVYLDVLGIDYCTADDVERILNELGAKLNTEVFAPVCELLSEMKNKLGEATADELHAMAEELRKLVCEIIDGAISGEYVTDGDSFYVSVEGENSDYAELLAGALGLGDSFAVMNWNEIDHDTLVKADFVTLGYDRTEISGFALDQLLAKLALYGNTSFREQFKAYLTLVLSDNFPENLVEEYTALADEYIASYLEHPALSNKEVEELDWAALVGEENVAYVEDALAEVAIILAEQGIDGDIVIPVDMIDLISRVMPIDDLILSILGDETVFELTVPAADIILHAVESYIYANVEFQMTYAEMIVNLTAANPDVEIAVLGQYNPFKDLTVAGVSVPVAKIYEKIADLTSAYSFAYALALPNVTYVDISGAESEWDSIEGPEEFITAYLTAPGGAPLTDSSNLYVMNQILAAYGLTCKHVYDDCEDLECNICGYIRGVAGHIYEAVVTSPDCEHEGYTTYTCSVCGDTYVSDKVDALGHSFGEWALVLEPSVDAEGREERVCSVCGRTESRPVDKLPVPGDDNTALVVIVITATVIVAAAISVGAIVFIKRKKL